MKTKIFILVVMALSISLSSKAVVHQYHLDNSTNTEFINVCAGPDDTLVIHASDTAVHFITWMDPLGNFFMGDDSVIVTTATLGNWYFSSTEAYKDVYVYFIQGLPTQPADMAHDSVFAQGTTTINWTLNAGNLTSGYSVTYQWDNMSVGDRGLTGTQPWLRTITDTGTYWLKMTNDCGTRTDTIHVTIYDSTTYVVNYDGQESFACRVYPNPTTDRVNLEIGEKDFVVEILSFLGQVILTGHNQKEFDISSLQAGTYIVRVTTNNEIEQRKIIVY